MDQSHIISKTLELTNQRLDFITSLANTCHTWTGVAMGIAGVCVCIVISFIIYIVVIQRLDEKKLKKTENDIDRIKSEFEKKYDELLKEKESSRQYFSKLFSDLYLRKIEEVMSQNDDIYLTFSASLSYIRELLSEPAKLHGWSKFYIGLLCSKILRVVADSTITDKNSLDSWWKENREKIQQRSNLFSPIPIMDIHDILRDIHAKLSTIDTTPMNSIKLPNGKILQPEQNNDQKLIETCRNKLKEIIS